MALLPAISFFFGPDFHLALGLIPYFFAYNERMVSFYIIAVKLTMVRTLFLADMVLAIGFLKLSIAFVLFVFEHI